MVGELNERNALLASEKDEMKTLIQEQEQQLAGGLYSGKAALRSELFHSYLI